MRISLLTHLRYIYGGWDPTTKPQATLYDDMYILSLPSFTWTKIYSGESPRFGHTCHLVGNRQLLTVGGSLSSYVTRECDWETKGVAILDLTTKIWGSVYNADAAPYQVTSDLLPVIGGRLVSLQVFKFLATNCMAARPVELR